MANQLLQQLLPSLPTLGWGLGVLLLVVVLALVQRAAQLWVYHVREERYRERVRRIEARWFEAQL